MVSAVGKTPGAAVHMIIGSLCTIPARQDNCQQVLHRILNEQTCPIDRLHVWLNGYAILPADLPQDVRVEYHLEPHNPGPWVRYTISDALGADDVLVTLDDDLEYPSNYIESGVQELSKSGPGTAVCFSGICWDPLVDTFEYGQDRWQYMAADKLTSPVTVALHKGQTSFFRPSYLAGSVQFPMPGFATNDDMMIGCALQQRGTKIQSCPKPQGWIRELPSSQAEHALFRRDAAVRHRTFRQMVRQMGFDPTGGKLAEFMSKPNRILVTAGICPPLAGSERLDEYLRAQCREDTGVHLVAPVPASRSSAVQRYVDVPYHIHAVTVPEPGGRLDGVPPVRAWRDFRVKSSTRRLLQVRVNTAINKLRPTSICEWDAK